MPRDPHVVGRFDGLQPSRETGGCSLLFYAGKISRCFLAYAGLLMLTAGCAIHYYDRQSGTEHLWGIGHMKMRAVPQQGDVPPFTNAVMAFATGVRTVGATLGAGEDFAGVSAGWDSRSRLKISAEDAHFYILWPSNTLWLPKALKDHFFTIRVGPDFPYTNGSFAPIEPPTNP